MLRPPPRSPLFPYTTLFRSAMRDAGTLDRYVPFDVSEHVVGLAAERLAEDYPGLRVHGGQARSEEHTSELQSHVNLVCRLLLEKKKDRHHLRLCPPRVLEVL